MNWEYKTIKLGAEGFFGVTLDEAKFDEFLNRLGAQGWELVNGFHTIEILMRKELVMVFKRQTQP